MGHGLGDDQTTASKRLVGKEAQMAKKKSAAAVGKAVEKQARAKKDATRSETKKSKGGELDTRESKFFSK